MCVCGGDCMCVCVRECVRQCVWGGECVSFRRVGDIRMQMDSHRILINNRVHLTPDLFIQLPIKSFVLHKTHGSGLRGARGCVCACVCVRVCRGGGGSEFTICNAQLILSACIYKGIEHLLKWVWICHSLHHPL